MEHVINIYDSTRTIDLDVGKYKIDVLGGWGVKLGEFSILFIHIQSGQTVDSERSFWPVQSFAFNKRARRIFIVDIVNAGTYKVEFRNTETLRVKFSNLYFGAIFQDPIPNDEISIYIH